jgi:hypothetical protein
MIGLKKSSQSHYTPHLAKAGSRISEVRSNMAQEMDDNPYFNKMISHFGTMVNPKKEVKKVNNTLREHSETFKEVRDKTDILGERMDRMERMMH